MPMRKEPFFRLAYACAALIVTLFAGDTAHAASYGTDFESLIVGDLNGQNGWTSGHGSSICPTYDVAVMPNASGIASFGAKTLRISNAVTCGSFNDQTFSPSLADEAGETVAPVSAFSGGTRQRYFEAQWDFASAVPGSEQPGLSVVASENRGDTGRMTWVQMTDTPSGLQVNFEDYHHDNADFVTVPVVSGLRRDVPHTIKVTTTFVDGPGNDVVRIYVDGALVGTGTTWEDYYREFGGGVPFAVDSVMFRVAGAAAPATSGHGFLIDNFTSYSGAAAPAVAPPQVPSQGKGTMTVVTQVVNDNGGTKMPSDFPLVVGGANAVSGETLSFRAPASVFSITVANTAGYATAFTGDCDVNGQFNLNPGDNRFCVVTEDDISTAPP
ncbi:MAG: hypothetical protein RLZZ324_934, partial [Candidatus Parcubacteria bacterium]